MIGLAGRSRGTAPRSGIAVRVILAVLAVLAIFTVMCLPTGCARSSGPDVLPFWAMGREGEVVTELIRDFESENPDIRVQVQQLPWSAAHEKLLTAFVGRSTPDLAQLGNTWMSEFAAIRALQPLPPRLAAPASTAAALDSTGFFRGIWRTNLIDGVCYGIPWYVDTRVLFYRKDLLAEAGVAAPPSTWAEWHEALRLLKTRAGPARWAILLPTDEWAQPVIFGLQKGASLLTADG